MQGIFYRISCSMFLVSGHLEFQGGAVMMDLREVQSQDTG